MHRRRHDKDGGDRGAPELGSAASLLAELAEAAIVADPSGRITFANAAVHELLGWDPAALQGQPLTTIVPERHRAAHLAGFARFAAGGPPRMIGRPVRLAGQHRDGREVEVELLLSAGPTPGSALALLRDVRDRLDLEAHSSVAQHLLQVLADVATEGAGELKLLQAIAEGLGWEASGLWVVDREARRLRCAAFWCGGRPGLERFRAVSEATLLPLGIGLPGRVWEEGVPVWVEDVSVDVNFPRRDQAGAAGLRVGCAFPVLAHGRFLGVIEVLDQQHRGEDPNVLGAMADVGELVGQLLERLWHDEERDRLLRMVQTERARLEAVQRRMPAGILVADAPSGRVVAGNDRLDALVGPPEVREEDGERILEYEFLGAYRAPYVPEELPFARAARFGEVTEGLEMELLGPDGRLRLVAVSAAPVRDLDGEVVSAVATFHDVTARRRTEDRHRFLSAATASLAQSLDPTTALREVAHLALGVLGESIGVYLVEDGHVREVAVAYATEGLAEAAARVRASYGFDSSAEEGVARVLRDGISVVYDEVDRDLLARIAADPEHLDLMADLHTSSAMLVPIAAGGAVIGVLAFQSVDEQRTFDADTVGLAEELGRRVGTCVAHARVFERERGLATTLQAALVPGALPELGWLDLAARFLPGGEGLEVGGDCYDAFTLGQDVAALVVGDVCGKGSEAAVRSAQFRHTTRALSEACRSPAEILGLVDAKVREHDGQGARFCTAVYARLDREADGVRCTVASAGHPLPFIVRADGRVEHVGHPGTLLFLLPEANHEDDVTTMHPGDVLVLYTDGVTEARSDAGWFGDDGLRRALEACAGGSADAVAGAVAEAALAFGGGVARDDVAVLAARCR